MQRIFLATMRFCLSAWVGMSIFFVTVVLDVLDSVITERFTKCNDPDVFLPPYFAYAFVLLGMGGMCAILGLWNARISLLRRYATLACVLAALGVAVLDYENVYQRIVEFLARPQMPAAEIVMLYGQSRLLKGAVLGLSIAAASMALWPVRSDSDETRNNAPPLPNLPHAGSGENPTRN
jgi:hypothetical protein